MTKFQILFLCRRRNINKIIDSHRHSADDLIHHMFLFTIVVFACARKKFRVFYESYPIKKRVGGQPETKVSGIYFMEKSSIFIKLVFF